jgi:nitrite reductase/ring-hydroxylating ferredoxin subunit
MAEKTRSSRKRLKGAYAAYESNRERRDDAIVTRVGRGSPSGEYFRRYWQPICLSSHLTDVPKRVRILGEDLVVFRDGAGRIGVLELQCSHRGTSLEYGKVREQGLQCCYHGWHFDIDGRILDTPGEPEGSPIKDRLWHGAYPAREWKGLVFAYMGPPDAKPEFPIYDAFERDDAEFVYRYWHSPCNWLQKRENEMDPIHLTFLHTRVFDVQFTPVYGEIPTMEWEESENGMIYLTVRRWKANLYFRVSEVILPNITRIAGIEDGEEETVFDRRGGALNWTVPIDDTNTLSIGLGDIDKNLTLPDLNAYRDRMNRAGGYTVGAGDVGQSGEPSYEQRQRAPGDWDAWVSQGPITAHSHENLGTTDQGIALYRKLVRQGIDSVTKGRDPKGILRRLPNAPLLTYAQNTIKRVPRAKSDEDERVLGLAFGRAIIGAIKDGRLAKRRIGAERPSDFVFAPPR